MYILERLSYLPNSQIVILHADLFLVVRNEVDSSSCVTFRLIVASPSEITVKLE